MKGVRVGNVEGIIVYFYVWLRVFVYTCVHTLA